MSAFDLPRPIFFGNMILACVSGFVANILLLYLISKRTPKEMRSYSRILRIHCITDMFYDFIQAVSGVQACPINGKIFTAIHGFEWQTNPIVTRIVIDFYFWSLLFSIALLPIDFLFRYLSVCKNRDLTNSQIFIMVFLAYAITFEHSFINTLGFLKIGNTPETAEYTYEFRQYWTGPLPPFSITVMSSYYTWLNFGLISVLNSFVYGLIIYTYSKINVALKRNANVVNNSRAMSIHRQVSRLLLLQASLPLLVICAPIMLTIILTLLNFNLPHFGAYCSFIYVWLGTTKSVLTILIVPRYRTYVSMKIFGIAKVSQRPTLTNNTGPSSVLSGLPVPATFDEFTDRQIQ